MNDAQAKNLSRAGLAAVVAAGLTTFAIPANAADVLLSGAITSAGGEKMGGVTVSAKAEGSVTTTTVYTDEAGEYYFPPLPAGKYKVWGQAVSFETAKGDVDLSAARSSRRSFAHACVDLTQRRSHIGGALGAALLEMYLARGWILRMRSSRAVSVTPKGSQALARMFA